MKRRFGRVRIVCVLELPTQHACDCTRSPPEKRRHSERLVPWNIRRGQRDSHPSSRDLVTASRLSTLGSRRRLAACETVGGSPDG